MIKKLLSDKIIAAYLKRLENMHEYKFTEEGDNLFIKTLVAETEQVNDLHVRTRINDFIIENDEPEVLGGTNLAPTPMQSLLASLSNCLEISSLLYFSFANLSINSIKVRVEATFDQRATLAVKEAPLPGFYDIKVNWFIDSEEKLKKIKQVLKKVEKKCPVRGSIVNPTRISEKIVLNGVEVK
jgi:uncharacterized OsmC-like protein